MLSITRSLTVLLVLMILQTVGLFALLAIAKRQESMSNELLKRSGNMQDTLELYNPTTRSQEESFRYGSGK